MTSQPVWDVFHPACPSRTSLARIANKWTAMIVITLDAEPLRFGELRTRVAGISAKVLTETLRDLERDGLVHRTVYAQVPPRVDYELTSLGRSLHEPMRALQDWAQQHIPEVIEARESYDATR